VSYTLKLAKPAPIIDVYEEPRPAGAGKVDRLEGYRDRRDQEGSAYYVPRSREQQQADRANEQHIP